jgi:hypothetical protein
MLVGDGTISRFLEIHLPEAGGNLTMMDTHTGTATAVLRIG